MEDNTRLYDDIDLRSDDVNELMTEVPHAILRYGIVLISFIVLTGVLVCVFVHYPQTVSGQITLSVYPEPVFAAVGYDGQLLELLVANGDSVSKGEMLAFLDSEADIITVLTLEKELKEWRQDGSKAVNLYSIISDRYSNLGSLQSQFTSLERAWYEYLSSSNRANANNLTMAVDMMCAEIDLWKQKFVVISPASGTVQFIHRLSEGQLLKAGEDLFAVVPHGSSTIIGNMVVSSEVLSEIKPGQEVRINPGRDIPTVSALPSGHITAISSFPDTQGLYDVEVVFPDNCSFSDFGITEPLILIKTQGNIVCKDQTLFKHIFLSNTP